MRGEGGVSPVFEVPRAVPIVSSLCLPLVDQDVSSHKLPQHHTCLLAAIFSMMIVIDSNPLRNYKTLINSSINCLGRAVLSQQ